MIKRLLSAIAISAVTLSANAALIFQGSSSPSGTVTMTPAEARAAWQAELFSFANDPLNNATVLSSGAIRTEFGNEYSEVGNGSTISISGGDLDGRRRGAPLIAFDVVFPTLVNAVGFDVNDNDGGGMTLELTDENGQVTVFDLQSTSGNNRDEFFGIVFDANTLITRLRVGGTDPGGVTTWDDFTTGIGQAAQQIIDANAPATLSIFMLAAAFAGFSRRKQK